jgi:hypothetical protein
MYRRVTAILMLSIIIAMPGCISDDGSIEQTNNDETETINQNENNTSVENTTSVVYIGFMDNSSIYGYRMDPGNFSRVFVPINEENCTTTGHDDWMGEYSSPLCVQEYGGNSTYNETLDCLTWSNDTLEECVEGTNMTISGRVMWWDMMMADTCAVFINSEQFVPSTTYNLTTENVTWDDLWADPAFVAWDSERMNAYNAEIGNQPSWCNDPMLNYFYWASQPVS